MRNIIAIITLILVLVACVAKNSSNNTGLETLDTQSNQMIERNSYSAPKLKGEEYLIENKKFLESTLSEDEIITINNIDENGITSSNNGGHYADQLSKPTYVKQLTLEKKIDMILSRLDTYIPTSEDSAKIAREWNKNHKK